MPHKIIVNGKECDVFSLEEIQSDIYLNGDIPMFNGKDMVEIVSMSRDESFSSTGEYYRQLSGYISCIADENERSEAWFLKEENIAVVKELIEMKMSDLDESRYGENSGNLYYKEIKSLLKQIK